MLFLFQFFLPLLHFSFSTHPKLDNVVILTALCGYEFYQPEFFFRATDFSLQNCRICEVEASKNFTKCLEGCTLTTTNTCTIAVTTLTLVSDYFSDNFFENKTRIVTNVTFSSIFSNDTGSYDEYSSNYCIRSFNFFFFPYLKTKLESFSRRSVRKMHWNTRKSIKKHSNW